MGSEKKQIVVAGKAYASVEEMPAEVRRVYELAVEARNQEHANAQVKLVFNGQEYESLDAMPPDVRKMYQNQQVAMETFRDFSVDATTPRVAPPPDTIPHTGRNKNQRPSFIQQNKWVILIVGVLVVLLILIIIK